MGARIPMVDLYLKAGINPKNGLPIKFEGINDLKKSTKAILRVMDEQDAVNRYQWYNLPLNISSQELERLLYYKSELCFFYFQELDEYYVMPYALAGSVDFYGRYNEVIPVPMTSGTDDKKTKTPQATLLSQKKLKVIKSVVLPELDEEGNEVESFDEDLTTKSCVILRDYTNQLSQTSIPRQQLNDGLLDVMSELIPYMRTALKNGTGIQGVKVQNAEQKNDVESASKATHKAALDGDPWVAIQAILEMQELTGGQVSKVEEYMMALQSLDNLRLSTFGLENGGLFEKKAHMLQDEAGMTNANVGLIYNDGLKIRQDFCNIVNSIWDLDIWCDVSENQSEQDLNGDGVIDDTSDPINGGTGNEQYDSEPIA